MRMLLPRASHSPALVIATPWRFMLPASHRNAPLFANVAALTGLVPVPATVNVAPLGICHSPVNVPPFHTVSPPAEAPTPVKVPRVSTRLLEVNIPEKVALLDTWLMPAPWNDDPASDR